MNEAENISMEQPSLFGQEQGNIMSMRWENKELIQQLWRNLAYLEVHYVNGKAVLRRIDDDSTPPINPKGARAIINQVQSVVNPITSLTKLHQDQAMILVKHIKSTVRRMVCVNQKEYECEKRNQKQQVIQVVENIVFAQLMRPVGGHESNHSRMNYLERRDEGVYTSNNANSWNPFKKPNTGGQQ